MPKKLSKKGRTNIKKIVRKWIPKYAHRAPREALGRALGPPRAAKRAPGRELGTINGAKDPQKTPRGRPGAPPGRSETQFSLFSQFSTHLSPPSSYERTLHNAPIFRLLLKVAVEGAHQCDVLIFYGALQNNRPLHTNAAAVGRSHCNSN